MAKEIYLEFKGSDQSILVDVEREKPVQVDFAESNQEIPLAVEETDQDEVVSIGAFSTIKGEQV